MPVLVGFKPSSLGVALFWRNSHSLHQWEEHGQHGVVAMELDGRFAISNPTELKSPSPSFEPVFIALGIFCKWYPLVMTNSLLLNMAMYSEFSH